MTDILIETPELRVRITNDLDPWKPDWDGSAFVLRLDYSAYSSFVTAQLVQASQRQEVPEDIVDLIRDYHSNLEWLKGLLPEDVVSFDYWTGYGWGSPTYVAFTTKALATSWGLDLEVEKDLAIAAESATLTIKSWRQWCEGEVYGYVLEERATWARVPVSADSATIETWEEIDGCSGIYGLAHAEEEGKAAFAAEAVRRGLLVST